MAANEQLRVGQGWDRHRLVNGDKLRLGAVDIPADISVSAHSDGDVLLHALIDALLGAAALEDIGHHFPPTSDRWQDVDSTVLLEKTVEKITGANWSVQNIDLTVIMEAVKLNDYRDKIKNEISNYFPGGVPVNVKFKTGEETGPVGRKEAVETMAVVLLKRENRN